MIYTSHTDNSNALTQGTTYEKEKIILRKYRFILSKRNVRKKSFIKEHDGSRCILILLQNNIKHNFGYFHLHILH